MAAVPKPRTPLERRALDEHTDTESSAAAATAPLVCRDWCSRCWHRWVRVRALEHLRGEFYWEELDRGDFGLLQGAIHPNVALVNEIVRLLETGEENMAIITRIVEERWSLDDALAILMKLDINARRLRRFPFLGPRRGGCR